MGKAIYTSEEIIKCIDEINPYLQEDGGWAEFYSYDPEHQIVTIMLKGRCENCPLALMTLRAGIERYIIKSLPNIRRIERKY